jgi:hypothetical protein
VPIYRTSRYAGNTYVLPEQKGPSPPTVFSLLRKERNTSNWDSAVPLTLGKWYFRKQQKIQK